jgi:asparagine synthase (glutamine-hydrolysing)
MCGIAGAVGPPVSPHLATSVLERLAHRGPDAEGSWQRGDVWLGFRRLAVLDLRAVANQPMVDEVSGVAIVFNGEIYNFVELRDELRAGGQRFRTTGDTEVLLRGYLVWGDRVVDRLNGMFAFAVHDPRRDGVLLGRDRFGEKPLHVASDGEGRWWFASEIGALLAAGAGSRRADAGRVAAFLAVGDVEDPSSSFVAGIRQVEPGTLVRLTRDGATTVRRWWSLDSVFGGRRAEPTPEEVREALDNAVRVRLRSDVEVGTSLSGGLDSSSVVAAVRAVDGTRRIHAFTASFPGDPLDEWHHAERVATAFGVQLHRVEPTVRGFLDDLDRLVAHQGGPFESPTVYAQWCVMREAGRAGVTVLLDGQGADETWGGYPKYAGFALLDDVLRARVGRAARAWWAWRNQGGLPRADLVQAGALLAPPAFRRAMVSAITRRRTGPALDGTGAADPFVGLTGRGLLARSRSADLTRVVLPRLLRYADRNSMAWGREVRLPFLDPSVVGLGLSSRWHDDLAQGWTKLALRRAVADRLPAENVWRRDKIAYQVPDEVWLRDRELQDALAEARRDLEQREVVARGATGVDPWRILTLSRFLAVYGLGT